jgi:thymidine phosphorylase
VARIACRAVGHAAMLLGAGRETVTSAIDPAVGLVLHKKVGDLVMEGEALVTVHLNDRRREGEVLALLKSAFTLAAEAPVRKPMIQAVLD